MYRGEGVLSCLCIECIHCLKTLIIVIIGDIGWCNTSFRYFFVYSESIHSLFTWSPTLIMSPGYSLITHLVKAGDFDKDSQLILSYDF